MEQLFLYATSHFAHECDWERYYDLCPEDDGIVRSFGSTLFLTDFFHDGHIPPEIGLLSHLEAIEFDEAQLVPQIDAFLPLESPNSLASLQHLQLSSSKMTGSIPSTLGLLTSLTHLDLSNNKLTSTIPSELGLLLNLTTLILSSNEISGTIPEELDQLSLLTVVQLEGNPALEPWVPLG